MWILPSLKTLDFTFYIGSTPTFLYFDLYLNTAFAQNVIDFAFYIGSTPTFFIFWFVFEHCLRSTLRFILDVSLIYSHVLHRSFPACDSVMILMLYSVNPHFFCTARVRPHLRYFDNDELCKVDTLMNCFVSNENNKRSVLRRQCSDINQNIKRLVYCRYLEYKI